MSRVLHDCLGLSSGTIASLIRSPRYSEIDLHQTAFCVWVALDPHRFASWMEAWDEWTKIGMPGILGLVEEKA